MPMPKLPQLRGILRKKITPPPKPFYPPIEIKEPRLFVKLPKPKDLTKVDVRYPLLEPFAYVRISWDSEKKNLYYQVEEPELTKNDESVMRSIEEALTETIDVKMSVTMKRNESVKYLEKKVLGILDELEMELAPERYTRIMYYIIRNFVGLNEIEPILHDQYIEDFGVSGLDIPIYVDTKTPSKDMTEYGIEDPRYVDMYISTPTLIRYGLAQRVGATHEVSFEILIGDRVEFDAQVHEIFDNDPDSLWGNTNFPTWFVFNTVNIHQVASDFIDPLNP